MKEQWDPARPHICNTGNKRRPQFYKLKGKNNENILYVAKIVIIHDSKQETPGNPTAH